MSIKDLFEKRLAAERKKVNRFLSEIASEPNKETEQGWLEEALDRKEERDLLKRYEKDMNIGEYKYEDHCVCYHDRYYDNNDRNNNGVNDAWEKQMEQDDHDNNYDYDYDDREW
jgi:hypothetical protein